MLQIENISFSYGKRRAEVFHDFSLSFEPGHIYGLLGKNGTGKSTLLYLICGLLRPTSGSVTFDGKDVKLRLPEVLQDIFLVPEEFELPNVTMETYVKLNAPFYPRFDAAILQRCLEAFELPATLNLGSLSMGQKKKAFMSFALATRTRLLIMDEPTNGLDIPSKSIFRKIVAQHISDEQAVIISTHQVRDVEMLLDHVVMLEGSWVLLNRSMSEISAAVRCEQRSMSESLEGALYVQPSLAGNAVLVPNTNPDDETPVNLELLFCCAESGSLPESLK